MSEKMFSNLNRMIEQVGKDKGISKKIVLDAVIQGMLTAARSKHGTYRDIEAQYNEETGEVELYEFKEVVPDQDFVDDQIEVKLSEALKHDRETKVYDSIGFKLDTDDLGRIAAQTAKQIIVQQVRDAEREMIFNEFEERKGEIASGIVRRLERGTIVVDLGKTEAYIPFREQIPGETYKPGDRVQGYISDVRQTTRGPQIVMSRSDERYLIKLFEVEVPEVYDNLVQIMSAAREPGQRAKIAVYSKDSNIDPVGACVGMKGSRVQNVIQELFGEKIDVVHWNEDPARFVRQALAPADISKIFVDEEKHEMEVVVPDDQLSLAIGRKGQNVRLSVKLTGWKIDILSESSVSDKTDQSVSNLMLIPGMTETMAMNIFQSGFASFLELSEAPIDRVMLIPGYETKDRAEQLVKAVKDLIEKYKKENKEIPLPSESSPSSTSSISSVAATPSSSSHKANEQKEREKAKLEAEERLQEELKQLATSLEEEKKTQGKASEKS